MGQKSRTGRILGGLVGAAVAVGLLSSFCERRPKSKPTGTPDPVEAVHFTGDTPNDVRALLDGLAVRSKIGAWYVTRSWIQEKRLLIELSRQSSGFTIYVTTTEASYAPPPHETARYHVFYGGFRSWNDSGNVQASETALAVGDVVERIRRRENEVPIPAGM